MNRMKDNKTTSKMVRYSTTSGQYPHQTKKNNVCPGCVRTKTGNQQKTGSVYTFHGDKARGCEPTVEVRCI